MQGVTTTKSRIVAAIESAEIRTVLTELAMSAGCSAACRLCCPMGDNRDRDERVGNVGTVFVVKRLCRPARSALDEGEGFDVNWPLEDVRTGDVKDGGEDSSRGDFRAGE
jgi:hypothetical protein